MKYWLSLNYEPANELIELARAAEEFGFDGVVLPDHIVVPVPSDETTRHPSGYHLPAETPYLEPLMCFAALASVTTRLRFLSDVLVVPLRDPFLLAKQLATLAILSGNRVVLGTGTGWAKDEFEIIGQGWSDRGKRMDESLDLMVDFWQDGWAERHGQHYDLPRSAMFPHPSQPIPIWVGGHSAPAMRRAARFDGYLPMRALDEVSRAEFAEITRLREEAGVTSAFERIAHWPGGDRSVADELAGRDGIGSVVTAPWNQYGAMKYAAKQASGDFEPYVAPSLAEKLAGAEDFAQRVIRG